MRAVRIISHESDRRQRKHLISMLACDKAITIADLDWSDDLDVVPGDIFYAVSTDANKVLFPRACEYLVEASEAWAGKSASRARLWMDRHQHHGGTYPPFIIMDNPEHVSEQWFDIIRSRFGLSDAVHSTHNLLAAISTQTLAALQAEQQFFR